MPDELSELPLNFQALFILTTSQNTLTLGLLDFLNEFEQKSTKMNLTYQLF